MTNAPGKTRSLMFTLHRGAQEYGGNGVPYPSGGKIAAGAVYSNGPCNPGDYHWTVQALGADGTILASAFKVHPFP